MGCRAEEEEEVGEHTTFLNSVALSIEVKK
jgi:hypothetical protein